MSVDKIIDEWMKEAEKSGELKHLKGTGKPYVPDRAYFQTPEVYRMAFKMLRDSGYIPPEVKMFKEVKELREKLETSTDEAERDKLLKKIADRELRIQSFKDAANRG